MNSHFYKWFAVASAEAERLGVKVVSRRVMRDAYIRCATPEQGAEYALTHYRNNVASARERRKLGDRQ
jgi:hypothetical protein